MKEKPSKWKKNVMKETGWKKGEILGEGMDEKTNANEGDD